MKTRNIRQLIFAIILLVLLLPIGIPTHAVPPVQDSADCDILNQEGINLYYQAQYFEALQKFQAAMVCYRERGDRAWEGRVLNIIGEVYRTLGQYQEALKNYRESLAIFRELGDLEGEGTALNSIGGVYHYLGQYQEALKYHQEALNVSREIGDLAGEGAALGNIGNVYVN